MKGGEGRAVRELIVGSQSQDLVRRPFTKTTRGDEGVGAGGWKIAQEMQEVVSAERGILWWVSWAVMVNDGARQSNR